MVVRGRWRKGGKVVGEVKSGRGILFVGSFLKGNGLSWEVGRGVE